jgi:hypothetical protein
LKNDGRIAPRATATVTTHRRDSHASETPTPPPNRAAGPKLTFFVSHRAGIRQSAGVPSASFAFFAGVPSVLQ